MARALAAAGADVAVHDREQPCAHRGVPARRGRPDGLPGRRTSPTARRRTGSIADTLDTMGRLDILVNNAGIIRRQPAAEHSDEDWDDGASRSTSRASSGCAAQPGAHMLERGGGGKIVNIASLLSFQGGITVPGYAAAKGGVAQLTKALANEWAPQGINVNAIAPGYMETDNTEALREDPVRSRQILERIPAGRWGDAGRSRRARWSSWRRARPTTCTATCWSSTAAGWAAETRQGNERLQAGVPAGRGSGSVMEVRS